MVKNVPCPCCGSYDVLIKSRMNTYVEVKEEKEELLYTAECPCCRFKPKEEFESKSEAIYEYESLCIQTWKRNRNGMMDWMKGKIEDGNEEERKKRIRIKNDVERLMIQYR